EWSSTTSTRCRTFLSIPASCGLSACSAVRPILPRPSARRVPRWRWLWPIALRVCLILSFAILCLLRLCRSVCHGSFRDGFRRSGLLFLLRAHGQHLADGQAARGGDLFGPAQALQAVDRRLEHVDRVRRAEALGEDVVDPAELEHSTDAAPGDDAGSLAGRTKHDPRCAEL